MKKPTILVDGHVLDGKPQGSSAYLAGLYAAVARQELARVMVACHDEASLERWYPGVPGIEWVPLKSTGRFARLGVELPKLQARIEPDFAHFHYICPLRKTGPWINTIHDLLFLDFPHHFPWKYRLQNGTLFRLSARRSDVVLTSSQYSRGALTRHFGIPKDRIHVIPAAPDGFVDAADDPVEGLSPGRFVVFVSRFEPRKNQHMLVEAFESLEGALDPDILLVLVGFPALDYPALDAALARAGDRVRVLSDLSHAQLTWLYRHAAGAVYPSHGEGFGMPVIEAVAAGGLSYCANNTSMAELVPYVHGGFDAADRGQIRNVLLRATRGQDFARRDTVRSRTLETFNWSASAATFMEAINA
jgi:glycosyltransferase involved in cell wall biosynthesis